MPTYMPFLRVHDFLFKKDEEIVRRPKKHVIDDSDEESGQPEKHVEPEVVVLPSSSASACSHSVNSEASAHVTSTSVVAPSFASSSMIAPVMPVMQSQARADNSTLPTDKAERKRVKQLYNDLVRSARENLDKAKEADVRFEQCIIAIQKQQLLSLARSHRQEALKLFQQAKDVYSGDQKLSQKIVDLQVRSFWSSVLNHVFYVSLRNN